MRRDNVSRGHLHRASVAGLSMLVWAATAGVAAAYLSAGGIGSGTGSAAVSTAPAVLSPATPVAGLYPGASTGVSLQVSNPNAFPVRINALVLDSSQGTSGLAVDAAHSGCGLGSLTYSTQTNGGAGWTVAASDSLAITLGDALAMSTTADNGCQGARFTIYLKAG